MRTHCLPENRGPQPPSTDAYSSSALHVSTSLSFHCSIIVMETMQRSIISHEHWCLVAWAWPNLQAVTACGTDFLTYKLQLGTLQ